MIDNNGLTNNNVIELWNTPKPKEGNAEKVKQLYIFTINVL